MSDKKQAKPVVVAIICKRSTDGFRIMTQMRRVKNPAYDPLYDNTWEAVGETLQPGEDVVTAVVRGIREECGMQVSPWWIRKDTDDLTQQPRIEDQIDFWMTTRGDRIILREPFAFVQSIGEPQPWLGPVFLVSVPPSWEPNFAKGDGEATEHRWWKPKDLLEEMQLHPEKFMGLHAPALRLLTQKLTKQ